MAMVPAANGAGGATEEQSSPSSFGPKPSGASLMMAAATMYEMKNAYEWGPNIKESDKLRKEVPELGREADIIRERIKEGVPLPRPRPR